MFFILHIGQYLNMRKNITMIAKMQDDGKIIPLTILWENGKTFNIDKVLDIRKKASTKGGGKGLRYTCKILGQERFLWLDDNIWFVEV